MVGNHHFTRVDTLELRDLIFQKIGRQRAEQYFDQLKKYLDLKISKVDFDKNCIRTIGRENISLHNRLIRSIVKNACHAKIPPQKARNVDGPGVKVANGYQRNCLQALYGDGFPQSPRKCRSSVNRDLKFRDRLSPLGPLGKSPSIITWEETVSRTQEQADLRSHSCRPPMDVVMVEDGEEVEQFSGIPSTPRWHSIATPLGVSLNTGGTRKSLHPRFSSESFSRTCQSSSELPDTRSLRSRLEKKLAVEGVGVSVDCANVLNNSLDVFLKRLIEPCIRIAGSRHADPRTFGRQSNGQMMSKPNGTLLPGRYAESPTQRTYASMLDFRVSIESNPSILGKDWPIQLEKICNHASE